LEEYDKPTPGGPAAVASSSVTLPENYAPSQADTELRFQGMDSATMEVNTSSDSAASDRESGEDQPAQDSDQSADMELNMMEGPPATNPAEASPAEVQGELAGLEPGTVELDNASPSASNVSADEAELDLPTYDSAPPLLQDTQLQATCLPFLRGMCQPPITQVEALIKARRVKAIAQLQPIKLNLRFIFGLLLDVKAITVLELSALSRLGVCQALGDALDVTGRI
jgi:hypothetical protein